MKLRAALMPTPAVVHVAGLNADPASFFAGSEVIAVQADDQGFARLVDFINASFERSGAARIEASGPGLYATSRFYPATGSFHLGNTCNTWTARAFAAAGFDVHAEGTSRAEALMRLTPHEGVGIRTWWCPLWVIFGRKHLPKMRSA